MYYSQGLGVFRTLALLGFRGFPHAATGSQETSPVCPDKDVQTEIFSHPQLKTDGTRSRNDITEEIKKGLS